uniref:Uncharacterized protein n=1 Tax=Mola mola TaxID=94237 RepID=A0A3Q3WII5_MOLML
MNIDVNVEILLMKHTNHHTSIQRQGSLLNQIRLIKRVDKQEIRLLRKDANPKEYFSGEFGDCRSFIWQCELHFEFNASAFSSDCAKIAFIISYLTTVCSLLEFLKTFTQIFQSTTPGREEAKALVESEEMFVQNGRD